MNVVGERRRAATVPILACAVLVIAAACEPMPAPTPTAPLASTEPSTATALPSPSASNPTPTSPAPSRPPTTWEQVFMLERGSLGSLIKFRDGFFVSGCVHDADDTCGQAIIVSSSDGRSWEVTEVDGTPSFGFGFLDKADERLYALGYGDIGSGGGAVVWTTLDGREWSPVQSTTFKARAVSDVIPSPLGTIAVGYNAPPGSDNASGFVTWPVNHDGSFGGMRVVDTSGSFRIVDGVVWTGDEFLAWGGSSGPYPSRNILLLSSSDGTTWKSRGEIRSERRISVSQILRDGDRLVAVGSQRAFFPLKPRAWTSDDAGRTWTSAGVEGDDSAMSSIAHDGSGLIARGLASRTGDDAVAVSWASARGGSWALLPSDQDLPAVDGFRGIVPVTIDDRTCVAGTIYGGDRVRAAIYCRDSG